MMLLDALYTEALRYLYVVSIGLAPAALATGALAALAGTFVFAAWWLRGVSARAPRAATPRRENA